MKFYELVNLTDLNNYKVSGKLYLFQFLVGESLDQFIVWLICRHWYVCIYLFKKNLSLFYI